ncbi:MAG TPA: hypothetical protein DCQ31_19310 [Bacteroidales bacterium]|nr:hypothetical protein [Bacteroidales bacterium]
MLFKHFLFIALVTFLNQTISAQYVKNVKLEAELFKSTKKTFEFSLEKTEALSSIAIQIPEKASFATIFFVCNNDTFPFTPDEEFLPANGMQKSNLIVLETPVTKFSIYQSGTAFETNVILLSVPPFQNISIENEKKTIGGGCSEPADIIKQSVWRTGLPTPAYERIFTQVKHVIVHHTAGSNSATNYTDVIRNIYIYHTQSNGWSDIGYNYLIAQNGTIYAGRDPLNGAQDNVMGAHFSGKNTNTMGISLMGNYEPEKDKPIVSPPTIQLEALQKLATWKLAKENLNPDAWFSHPLNANLSTLSGHRDGGNTACPGTEVYKLLPTLRKNIKTDMETNCGFNFTGINEPIKNEVFELFPNPATSEFYINSIEVIKEVNIYNMLGLNIIHTINRSTNKLTISVENLPVGIYTIELIINNKRIIQKLSVVR